MNDSIERSQIYRFSGFEVDTLAHEVRKQGVRIRLQQRPYQILLLILERAGKVVTREELRQRLWTASVFVDFDHGLNNVIARLREALGDDAVTPRFIETIPRVGYRFLDTVTTLPDEAALAAPSAVSPASVRWSRNRWLSIAAAVAVAVLLAALLRMGVTGHLGREKIVAAHADVPAPSIAVLPFINLTSNEDDESFSDGLTEEVVTKLGGIRGLKVIARTSSVRFKGKQAPARAIAQALQVDHLLEGSVRRSGNRLRITAQLIDARADKHIWAQTFDRAAGDIFQIQEDIAFAIAAALKVSLLDTDEVRIRRRGTRDAAAYRLYLIAEAHMSGRSRVPDMGVVKRSLDAAIERDPNFAAAHAGLARYYFRRAWGSLTGTEESARLGIAAAERAVALDPESSEALQARANFEFWRYRFRGDYEALGTAEKDMQRAVDLDPSNTWAFEDFGRALLWNEPELASSLLEHAIQIDVFCTSPNLLIATLLGNRGQLEPARKRCAQMEELFPGEAPCRMAVATLDTYFGEFEPAVNLLQAIEKSIGGAARIELWSVHMSMGDRAGAQQWLDFGNTPMEKTLSDAARFAMDGHYDQAFTVLDLHRNEFPFSRLLDLPTAKFALIAGRPQQAREILEQRLPDLVSGIEPISARNLLPALDLATAQLNTGAGKEASALLKRIAAYLDGPSALRLPMFAFQRARTHALAGEPDAALRALDRAYDEGLRTTWALDLRPQSALYIDPIDVDPAFRSLLTDPHFTRWLKRIRADNARQLEHLSTPRVASTYVRSK